MAFSLADPLLATSAREKNMKEWSMFSKWPDCRAFVSCCTEVGHAEFPKGCIDLDDLMSCSDCRKDQEVS